MGPGPVHLVFGVTGQVGFELVRELSSKGRVVGLSRPEVDLEQLETVRDAIRAHRPTVIWNAAAATAVDALESDPDLAFRVNAKAPGVMSEEAKRTGALLVHFSTDYVFDGTKGAAYVEDDPPNPLNVYGRSKLAGELAVRDAGARHLIIRTGWVYSSRGRNFVRAVLSRSATLDVLRVVNDQVGAPTWSRALARGCARIATRIEGQDCPGLLHLSAAGSCSWFDFAMSIRDQAIQRGHAWRASIEPLGTAEYPAKARRPRYSILASDAAFDRFGVRLPDWRASHDEFWAAGVEPERAP